MKLTPAMLATMKHIAFFQWLFPTGNGNALCHESTRKSLERRGLITLVESQWRLTPAGKEALRKQA